MIEIIVYCHPEPQGSARAFVRNGRANITTDNKKLKPFRSEVTRCAIVAMDGEPMPKFGKHVPVEILAEFRFRKPATAPKKRKHAIVKPDLDKLLRATLDALTGVVFHDDAQVVEVVTRKVYGEVEGVSILAREVEA